MFAGVQESVHYSAEGPSGTVRGRADSGKPGYAADRTGGAGSARGETPAEADSASPMSAAESAKSKGASPMSAALPREAGTVGSPPELGSPTYKAIAQHAASIETFLAAGDASTSAREESSALAQLMQVLNDSVAPDEL